MTASARRQLLQPARSILDDGFLSRDHLGCDPTRVQCRRGDGLDEQQRIANLLVAPVGA